MRVAIAIDSFKGSLTSMEAGAAVAEGILRVYKDADICIRPLADGGEGTVDALTGGMGGRFCDVAVTGPLGSPVKCRYGMIEESGTAVIEMAAAAGITMVLEHERNPMNTTTYGVGEVIKDAISNGCRRFIVGIGGSATNDGGIGMLQALGYGILNKEGEQVAFGAKGLGEVDSISDTHVLPELSQCTFRIACDVTNPLCGAKGSSAVFGPQKGAGPEMILEMDRSMAHFAKLVKEKYLMADPDKAGAGAAGGLGFAFLSFLNAELESGLTIVLDETKLEEYIQDVDIVVTGEGRLDGQSVMGKAPIGVAKAAKNHDKLVIAFSGCVTGDAVLCNKEGIDAFFPILRTVVSLEEAMETEHAKRNLCDTAEQVFRLIRGCK